MQNKFITILIISTAMFAIVGCSSNSVSAPSSEIMSSSNIASSSNTTSSSNSSLFADQSWPTDHEMASKVPTPSFSVPPKSIYISGSNVTGEWENLTEQEVADYITAIKESVFTGKVSETRSNTYYSYRAEENIPNTDDQNNDNKYRYYSHNLDKVSIEYEAATDTKPTIFKLRVSDY